MGINNYTIALIVAVCVIAVVMIILLSPKSPTSSNLLGGTTCSISSLPDILSFTGARQCKSFDGSFYSTFWYDPTNDWVLGPLSTPQFSQTPEQICFGRCFEGTLPYTCPSDNPDYSLCVSQLSPGDCGTPTKPIAIYENVPLYVISVGGSQCL